MQDKTLTFRLDGVKVNNYSQSFFEDVGKVCFVENQIRAGINWDQKRVIVGHHTIVYDSDSDNKQRIAELDIDAVFWVDEFEEMITKKEDPANFDINILLLRTLVSITYSTARGIFIGKGAPTLLPVVDPGALIGQREPVTQ